jgi:DNA-binding response OmpR family regulator
MQEEAKQLRHCLIAESDQFIAKLLLRYAEGSDLVCERAKVGEDVVSLARQFKPHVIIIDAEFPGDAVGWEIIRNLKAADDTRQIALISCSWLSQAEVRSLVGNLTAYLQKPNISYSDFETALHAAGVMDAGVKPSLPGQVMDDRR